MTQIKPITKIIAVTMAISLLSACGYGRSGVKQTAPPTTHTKMTPGQHAAVPNPTTHHDVQVAEHIAQVAKKIDGVTKATAVVNRQDAVVGVDVKQGSDMKQTEKKVHAAVKSAEPSLNVHVTSDAKLHGRIQSIHSQTYSRTQDGHPVKDMGADISSLIRDIGRTVTAPFR
ncbi:YhcN/YlaJ family sporulation lipoprotein [Brevibacillus choshinensis]|uniref:YhcN/YlaJ family sporulation lipoprotein n=1 Tax=Brevibacillus choshinensis TaxID=54911 RepID=UPI002E213778|nr:YhcN/YlaJ family sporulation lipoprotein [Brevibacillus choshinensis]MED4749849.1 YhcN/YlaJ family sporulation lipoprotein [Brevibacillus choshinensis]